MPWVAAGGAIVSGYMASKASSDAAAAGMAMSDDQIDLAEKQLALEQKAYSEQAKLEAARYKQNRADMLDFRAESNAKSKPYEMAGYNALAELQYGLGLGGRDVKNTATFD